MNRPHETARRVIGVEARELKALAERLGTEFDRALQLLLDCKGRVVLSGMGKSGIVARKIASTLASTGTPSFFLHPAEARHGDMGALVGSDVVIAISQSGEAEELLALIEPIRRLGATLIALSGQARSTLAREADLWLDTSVQEEGCPLGLAPMASSTVALALGDALAAAAMVARGFSADDFAARHPGGRLGVKLLRVEHVMHGGESLPKVEPRMPLQQVVVVMSRMRLGCAVVADPDGRLLGLITDGDLRRWFEREQNPLARPAEEVMTRRPLTIAPDALAGAALRIMEERKITMLPVVSADGVVRGVVQIHDLWRTGLV